MGIRSQKMSVAYTVLEYVKQLVDDHDDCYPLDKIPLYLEAYSNGREQGYCLGSQQHKVCFAENRNSDDIVIYMGRLTEFQNAGNMPTDRLYQGEVGQKHYFSYDEERKAAETIFNYFKTQMGINND